MTNQTQNLESNIENITFGVELETSIPPVIRVGAYHHGSPIEGAPKFQGAAWLSESDCSIRPERGHVACEFVSPILKGEAGILHLIEFVEWLTLLGAKVNSSCGVHVHVGVRGFAATNEAQAKFVKILSRLVTRNATAFYAQTGTLSREQGHYCKRADSSMRKQISAACSKKHSANGIPRVSDRYQLLNLTNLQTKGTVEFRCFAGTLNVEKLLCHLLSVFLLCKVAAGRKSLTNWDPAEQFTGTQALHNLLKVRPTFTLVQCATFSDRRSQILAKGFEMAAKYDQAKLGRSPNAPQIASQIA
jgi:hypothetical protein